MATRNIIIRPLLQYIKKSAISITAPPFLDTNVQSFSVCAASHHSNLASLFQRYGFSPSQMPDFLRKNEFLLDSSPSEVEKSFKILLSLKLSQDFLVSTVSSCPRVLELEFLKKWQMGFLQLQICNITSKAVKNVLEVAKKLGLSPDDVLRCILYLKDLGLTEGTIIRILEEEPMVMVSKRDEIMKKVEFLMGIGVRRKEINRIICLFPGILAYRVENRLKPLFDEFEDLGFSLSEVKREVLRDPVVLELENGELIRCMELLRSLKCRMAIKERIFRRGEFRAGYEVKLRISCLRKHGLIYRDAFAVLWKEPRVILYEIGEIEKKIEFLVQKMRFDLQCLVEVPEYLGLNLDKQIVPRFNVIDNLRSKGGVGDELRLRNLVKLTRLKFYNMYVKPYPELEKVYGRFSGEVQVRSRHPVGMWKLFRPQQYLKSMEDAKNVE
ncbi:transcription termination factor MTERF15, mitochondrial [Primulina huaijiensis]|uniref:transcription termination factor MTERF15, mitochondrial n=1 Tax=Primulina huaijiensis TaxID=1492673 RepID=UPI003CC78695